MKKINFFIKDEGRPLDDMCRCQNNDCQKNCGRKRIGNGERYYSVADLSVQCKSYEPLKK